MRGASGLILAAPASGSGKTVLTLALLRALRQSGCRVASVKTGPDYIDPAFHAAASGRACTNLDPWAMRPSTLAALVWQSGQEVDLVLAEGAMGLFDGVASTAGSTAELAMTTGWPVVLVIDVRGQGGSVAAVVHGFHSFRPDLNLAGVLFNRVGSSRHEALLRTACAPLGVPVLGAIKRHAELSLPNRHLGLIQANEHPDLEIFLERAASVVSAEVDLPALRALARPSRLPVPAVLRHDSVPPLGQRLAVARDVAFAFAYDWLLDGWRARGVEVFPFSPLAGDAPPEQADAIYLPGGYPELHAGRLASNTPFLEGVRRAARRGIPVWGECGGYMVLGQGLCDAAGERHPMVGLLGLESSLARRKLHLGYRRVRLVADTPLGSVGTAFRGHEFHYASILSPPPSPPLFMSRDANDDETETPVGEKRDTVMGSFIHLIDRATDT